MTNLLSNAIKFSPRGRPVVVESSCRKRLVRISVRDHGRGVPASFRQHVFEKFAQANPSSGRGGSGLGLSISKAIVERLGGHIGFRTSAGHGATFFFDLPEWRPARSRRK
jgi:signal transduction histidine kinase